MKKLLYKEFNLSANTLSYVFTLFGFMFLLPGYPILCGAFFVSLRIFFSFQTVRESNDILFTALLPIKKKDAVKSKFLYVLILQSVSFVFMIISVLIRLNTKTTIYINNALMNANFFALALCLLIFSFFNLFFICGFYKTAYYFTKPFITFCALTFVLVFVGEAVHYINGLNFLNSFKIDMPQIISLILGLLFYTITFIISLQKSMKNFLKIDL